MRTITIFVNEAIGVANYIDVGNKVATYQMELKQPDGEEKSILFAYTQLQDIEVLALGRLKPALKTETVQQPASLILLVNPAQSEVLAFVTFNGSFHITLRNPTDNN